MDIYSVLIYLTTFGISIICIYLSEHIKGNQLIKWCLTIIGVLTICLLAAFRDTSVGSDVKLYLVPNYHYAILNNLDFWEYFNSLPIDNEILFAALIYLISKVRSLSLLCFVIELLAVTPILYVLKKRRKVLSVTLGYTLYLFLFYNFSLSGMRASIAISFFILAFHFWQLKKLKIGCIYCLIAIFFQKSTFFILVIVISIYFIENSKKQKKMFMRVLFLCFISILLIGYTKLSVYIMQIVNIINPRYGNYMQIYLKKMPGFTVSNIPSTDILFKTLIVLSTFFILKYTKKMNKEKNIYFALCLMGRYFVIFNAVFYESMRIAYFFDYFIIIFVSCFGKGFGRNCSKVIEKVGITFLAFIYWIYYIMVIGGYGTNVYMFR